MVSASEDIVKRMVPSVHLLPHLVELPEDGLVRDVPLLCLLHDDVDPKEKPLKAAQSLLQRCRRNRRRRELVNQERHGSTGKVAQHCRDGHRHVGTEINLTGS